MATLPWPEAAAFPIGDARPDGFVVAPGGRRAVYVTPDLVVCVDGRGEVWRFEIAPPAKPRPGARAGCAYSLDGATVWVYMPDAMARDAGPDRWLALDGATGRLIDAAALPTVGQGARHFAHPDAVHLLLDVGEGQDGCCTYRARIDDGRIELHEYPWTDRSLVAIAPDGRHFMTVDHGQADAAFHTYPDGDVVARVAVEALGHDPDEAFVEWIGGYLDVGTAVVTVAGETEDEEEWLQRYLVNPHTGAVLGRFESPSEDVSDPRAPGGGA
ncbi:hypothetical protein [Dactylosporangium sp. CA-139066]|uniref:hypothetical protein n=1 Tax=Dactylosporangium sp. CA-139066 TaxID=3239930 RepID=UPI003D8B6441